MCRSARLDVATDALTTPAITCSLITRITEWIAQFPLKTFNFQGNRNIYLSYREIYSSFYQIMLFDYIFYLVFMRLLYRERLELEAFVSF